jgi:internalin A
MKMRAHAAAYYVVLVVSAAASADNPAPHLSSRTEVLFNPTADAKVATLMDKVPGVSYHRDVQLPGTPIVDVFIQGEVADDRVFMALQRLPFLRHVTAITGFPKHQVERLTQLKQLESLHLSTLTLGATETRGLASMPRLRDLEIGGCGSVSEDALKELASSPRLRSLELSGCRVVTHNGVTELSRLKGLQRLGLNHTGVTDTTLAELASWPTLRSLSLSGTAITDTGLRSLARSKILTNLDLSGTKVTDDGLRAVAKLTTLRSVGLTNCEALTPDGVRRLKAALLECEVHGP